MLIQSSSNVAPSAGLASSGAPTPVSGNTQPPENHVTQVSQGQLDASPAQLQGAITSLNNVMQGSNVSLSFSLDSGTDTPVVNVTDTTTGKVITQFPSKATLAIAEAIDASQKRLGVLFNQKA